MLARLARETLEEDTGSGGARAALFDAESYVAHLLDDTTFVDNFVPIPLRRSVGLQVLAALSAAAALNRRLFPVASNADFEC